MPGPLKVLSLVLVYPFYKPLMFCIELYSDLQSKVRLWRNR
jgi:hypothetical protein